MNLSPETVIVSDGKSTLIHLNFAPSFWGGLYFAGYDLNLLELFFGSKINLIAVGDPRQATFSTNTAGKNRQFRRGNIFLWLKEKEKKNEIAIEEINESHRCNKPICDFASNIFPDLPKMISTNLSVTGHDGIFSITNDEVDEYVKTHKPIILRYNKNTDTLGFHGINIGLSKGKTYERVLIFPTKTMIRYLKTKDNSQKWDKSKFYVAITRARHSVAIVMNDINN